MATTTDQTTEDTASGAAGHHPTPKDYVQVFFVLFVLTAMEVAASFIDVGPLFLPLLIVLMVIKFALVAGWFMHLKYDIATYTQFMVGGLLLALGLYGVVLLVFSDAVRA
jgi:cytochrome c oxidase subunit 4